MASSGSDNSNNNIISSSSSCDDESVKYKGVRKRKWGKWVSEIRLPNSRDRIWLGSFNSPHKAARAFDAALYCLRGSRATFNFPDTPFLFHLPPSDPQSLTHHDIQLLAAAFANQAPPPPPSQEAPNKDESSVTEETTPSAMQLDHLDMDATSSTGHTIDWSFLKSLECWNNSEESSSSDVTASSLPHYDYDYAYDFDPSLLLNYVDPNNAHPITDNHHDQSLMLWSFQYD